MTSRFDPFAAPGPRWYAIEARRPFLEDLAAGVLDHLRAHAALADPLRDSGWFDPRWLGEVLDGSVLPQPNTVAFMMNVLVGQDPGGANP